MSTLDAGFYFVEHENVPMHIGSLAVFEGPAPTEQELLDLYESKLPRVPRYRQVVHAAPLQVFRPFWSDDPRFELRYHVRHTAVPPPGGPDELAELADRIFSQRLDRDRPLWESWLIVGLEQGRWAVISKVHHCMVDGIGGSDIMAEVFDTEPQSTRPVPVPWLPQPGSSVASLVAGGALDAVAAPARHFVGLPKLVRHRLRSPAEVLDYGRGLVAGARRLAVPSASRLNGRIGPKRRWRTTTAGLRDVKRVRKALEVTVNDVILAMVTTGFRDLLAAHGELADGIVVRSVVPVSLRSESDEPPVSNRLSALLVNLPVGEADPRRRLQMLHDQMDDLKRTRQAVGPELLTALLGTAAPSLLALGSRAAFRIPQPLVQTVTTNVPGPNFPLFMLGRRLVELYPYVPIADSLRIGIAIFSYLDSFGFGITADHGAVSGSDLEVLTKGIAGGLDQLQALARPARRHGGSKA